MNSIDVVFNFDCLGFTGTPFIDNYPTFSYIKSGREVGDGGVSVFECV